ncbi:MAG: DUF5107 domain-containing protein [Armatimonadetes bacterium]|nr:DUF5107 domain-containing protein [Armatimonadota bacterium]
MSALRLDYWQTLGAELGPENPLPALAPPPDIHASVEMAPDIPEEDQRYVGYGRVSSCLPYLIQDGYTRDLKPLRLRTAVLENEFLRATFLLDLGGRLWSLFHKPTGRELLQVNPVLRFANVAIRNAWFSGGVEWNIGMIGHCVFTCSPVFAARVQHPDGTAVLRLYEWERIRRVVFQIDAYLPDGSPVLFIRPRIINPNPTEVPMYWWSNMAVPETPDTRVITPADHAYRFGYKGGLQRVPVPLFDGKTDCTYPTNLPHAMDFFFRIPDGHQPWIAALNAHGMGLGQTSTMLLKGRKLFVWGQGPGGKRWQEFLAQPGCAYIEIQAGLARTQVEHLPMPAGAEWEWLEAYGLIEADPDAVHGADWQQAIDAVQAAFDRLVTADQLEEELARSARIAHSVPSEILHRGSGWGALEQKRRKSSGEPPMCGPELVFDDTSIGEPETPWLTLLTTGEFPPAPPSSAPRSYMIQPEWRVLLEQSVAAGRSRHWLAWLHLGILRYASSDRDGAREAWQRSCEAEESPWALRNLAVIAREEGRHAEAAELILKAARLRPDLRPLVVECGRMLVSSGRPAEWLAFLGEVPESVRRCGRVVLLEAQAALAVGDLDTVERILGQSIEIPDLREGEVSLSDLWYAFHEQRLAKAEGVEVNDALRERVRREFPPPPHLDFRMGA